LTVLISAAFLATGAQASYAALGPTGTTGATGAQQTTTTCPTPKLKVPKRNVSSGATVKFKLTNMTTGAGYIIRAGTLEVWGGAATTPTVKASFLFPYSGTKDRKSVIAAVIDSETCDNAPWKIEKKVQYRADPALATPAEPATPTTPAPAAVTPAKPIPTPTPTPTPIKPPKLPKPLSQRIPKTGPPLGQRVWLTPIDTGARLDQRLPPPVLSRLERKADEASSTTALVGLGIVFAVFGISTLAALMVFRRRDEIQFEKALGEQLKHLEEGDPGLEFAGDEPSTEPIPPAEQAPFAAPVVVPPMDADGAALAADVPAEEALPVDTPAEEALPAAALANGAAVEHPPAEAPTEHPSEPPTEVLPEPAVTNGAPTEHRAHVEAELQRVLDDAGFQAELHGILVEARGEAERQGIAIDTDMMLQALVEEINGSTELSDPARAQLRSKFEQIIAEEAERVPAQ
jgi:hypothetical protein